MTLAEDLQLAYLKRIAEGIEELVSIARDQAKMVDYAESQAELLEAYQEAINRELNKIPEKLNPDPSSTISKGEAGNEGSPREDSSRGTTSSGLGSEAGGLEEGAEHGDKV